jgi:hypothetical protein
VTLFTELIEPHLGAPFQHRDNPKDPERNHLPKILFARSGIPIGVAVIPPEEDPAVGFCLLLCPPYPFGAYLKMGFRGRVHVREGTGTKDMPLALLSCPQQAPHRLAGDLPKGVLLQGSHHLRGYPETPLRLMSLVKIGLCWFHRIP